MPGEAFDAAEGTYVDAQLEDPTEWVDGDGDANTPPLMTTIFEFTVLYEDMTLAIVRFASRRDGDKAGAALFTAVGQSGMSPLPWMFILTNAERVGAVSKETWFGLSSQAGGAGDAGVRRGVQALDQQVGVPEGGRRRGQRPGLMTMRPGVPQTPTDARPGNRLGILETGTRSKPSRHEDQGSDPPAEHAWQDGRRRLGESRRRSAGFINWLLHRNGYAYRKVYFDGKRRNLYLHRYVMRLDWGCREGRRPPDNDRLNNRRNNLEVVTNTENNLRKWMRYWQGNAALSMPLDDGIPI